MRFLFHFASLLSLFYASHCQEGSVVFTDGEFLYKEGIIEGALAYGSFNDTIETTGWATLDITADRHKKYSGDQIMYAAGLLEGVFSSNRIYQHYKNLEGFLFDNRPIDTHTKMCSFLGTQQKWLKMQVALQKDDTFWQFVGYMQSQIEGLYNGFKLKSDKNFTMCQMQITNSIGDMIDLLNVFDRKPASYFVNLSRERFRRYAQMNGHCSALIKVTPGYENMYMGHDSWFVYSAMLRIYKNYDFKVFDKDIPNSRVSFSSYPGFLSSLDDFYILGSGMVMLQTTNGIYNTSLYDQVVPQSLLAWQRVRVANMLAANGREWGELVGIHNSGTYNNQYMVIDLKKFTPSVGLEDGALYVVEQIPGLVESHDQTHILREGYWGSYNVPFYETIYNMSGYVPLAHENIDNSHDLAPRAKIFRRDQSTVDSMLKMKEIMRLNNYKNDEYSEMDACNTICCRGDLQHPPSTMGCYDTKVTDFFLAWNFTAFAQSGPTLGGKSSLPPFAWNPEMTHHAGMPNVYNFPFITMKPKYFP